MLAVSPSQQSLISVGNIRSYNNRIQDLIGTSESDLRLDFPLSQTGVHSPRLTAKKDPPPFVPKGQDSALDEERYERVQKILEKRLRKAGACSTNTNQRMTMMNYLDNNQQPSESPFKPIKLDKDLQTIKVTEPSQADYSSDDSTKARQRQREKIVEAEKTRRLKEKMNFLERVKDKPRMTTQEANTKIKQFVLATELRAQQRLQQQMHVDTRLSQHQEDVPSAISPARDNSKLSLYQQQKGFETTTSGFLVYDQD